MTDALLTIDETARLGRVSRRTVERELARGNLEAVRIGERSVRIRESDARRWAGLPATVGLVTQPMEVHRG